MDSETIAIYDRIALEWAKRRGGPTDDLAERFRDRVGPGAIADLGCGPGRYLAQLGSPVVGLDATARMLSAIDRASYPLVQADLESLPFRDSSLHGIFARHSYLHVPKDRLHRCLVDARRALRTGGLFLMTMIEGNYEGRQSPKDDFPGRYFSFWSVTELQAVVSATGLMDVRVDHVQDGTGYIDLLITAKR